MTTSKDTRLRCSFCGVRTWQTDFVAFMRDHDRENGRKCRRAAQAYAPKNTNNNDKGHKP